MYIFYEFLIYHYLIICSGRRSEHGGHFKVVAGWVHKHRKGGRHDVAQSSQRGQREHGRGRGRQDRPRVLSRALV